MASMRMNNLFENISHSWAHLKEKTLFLACSGGVDSITLLHILHQANFRLEVIHINYQLREEDSEKDMLLVQQTCSKLAIPFHLKKIDLQPILNAKGGNLQEIARNIRYDFFEEKKSLSDHNYIVLGHHKNDQIETFFMHLARKSGIMGMACMPAEHHRYIRPLLPFSKEEIISYARENKIEWREDYSNKTNKYTRNILRNILLPELQQQIHSLEESVLLLVAKFQETQLELEKSISPICEKIYQDETLSFLEYDSLNENEKVELLRQFEQKASLLNELEKLRCTQKGKLLNLEQSSSRFHQVYREDSYFKFVRGKSDNKIIPTMIIHEIHQLPSSFFSNTIYLDPTKIKGDLNLRKWNKGDRMRPFGMNGSKLISDIIKDAKTPSCNKKEVLVLTDDEKILWCVHIRCGAEAIATLETDRIWEIKIHKNE